MKLQYLFLLFLLTSSLSIACDKGRGLERRNFGIFTVLDNDTTIEMDGVIGRFSLKRFNKLINRFPNIRRINIVNCDGSSDDETNLLLSRKVHQKSINIHLLNNAEIASGGVDFYLSGIQRTKGSNTKIGVHSWDGANETATDFPVGHANHLPYIEYYVSIGFTQQQAEDFYYFTINAAPAESIHWMTDAEIELYNIITH